MDIIVNSAEAKKALGLKSFDVRKTSKLVDFVVICSGDSTPHLAAIEKEIDKNLKNVSIKGLRWEGTAVSGWVLLDLGNIIVHVMRSVEREYYQLEELWEDKAIVYHY
ncbi:MAG: ribosome silencing factor [Candidatus Margulisbacteria bacterium]|nr:ribosome silencing factor [Candidatus Margulisiibacteriota bacterium]